MNELKVRILVGKQYSADLPENYNKNGTQLLQDHWIECIKVEGDYFV